MSRRSGVLAHVTSLPSKYGIGDMGPGAFAFVDFLHNAGQGLWQVLPLNPTNAYHGSSPYSTTSAFALNLLLLSPEVLATEGLLSQAEVEMQTDLPADKVDFGAVVQHKERVCNAAFGTFKHNPVAGYDNFCEENASWLDDHALYAALKGHFEQKAWFQWPDELARRAHAAIEEWRGKLAESVEKEKVLQFLAHRQWESLRRYCNERGISIMGDVPIYVDYDSVDVWANPGIFKLDEKRKPAFVSGVPPDYFSRTGQLWGNPVYDWDALQTDGFGWWIRRMERAFQSFDVVRIDHFRGLVAFWEIPAGAKTAVGGNWAPVPSHDLFSTLQNRFGGLSVVAEDLGIITDEVQEVMNTFDIPGMKVLLFAFGDDNQDHPYLPHTYEENCVAYTGTHDNNTVRGWFEKEASKKHRKRVSRYVGRELSVEEVHVEFMRLLIESRADMVIFPLQDMLGLGQGARMNRPGTSQGNWLWRVCREALTDVAAEVLRSLCEKHGRLR